MAPTARMDLNDTTAWNYIVSNVSALRCRQISSPHPPRRNDQQTTPHTGLCSHNSKSKQGPESIFTGYAWSLDTFVDYAWLSLGNLKTVLIVLLVAETLCVQMTCMLMLTLLVKVRATAFGVVGLCSWRRLN